jgi:hypothetical protein
VARYQSCAASVWRSHLAMALCRRATGPLLNERPWKRCVKSATMLMFVRGEPADAVPAALKFIQRLVSNAGTDAWDSCQCARTARAVCMRQPSHARPVRPIGPVVLRNRSSLKAGVRTSYFSCKRPVRAPKEDECRWLCFTDLMIVSDGPRRWLREAASVYEPAMLPLLSVPFGASPAASTDVYFSRQSSSSVPCWQPLPLSLLRARSWFCHAYQSFRCQCFCHSCRHSRAVPVPPPVSGAPSNRRRQLPRCWLWQEGAFL